MSLHNIALITQNNTELKLLRMKELTNQIKVLEAEYGMLKDEVIQQYFVDQSTYKTKKGLILATYLSYTEQRFNGSKFQRDFPDIYDNYKEARSISKFLLK